MTYPGKISVTYGPCQTPTLWFVCHRHDTIATHVPRAYWTVQASVRLGELSGGGPAAVSFASSRGPVWSEAEAE